MRCHFTLDCNQVLCRGTQSKKLEAEVLAPMARWTSAYTTVQVCPWQLGKCNVFC